jgi:calcineurin-like phosphoesterase family protein
VYHLGDVALGSIADSLPLVGMLNGKIILCIGNHDRIFRLEKEKMQQRFVEEYNKVFDDYYDDLTGMDFGFGPVNLSHFPYDGDSHDGDRYTEVRLPDDGTTLIHGHTHAEFHKHGMDSRVSRSKRGTLQIHVGMDAWHYRPVHLSEVEQLVKDNS